MSRLDMSDWMTANLMKLVYPSFSISFVTHETAVFAASNSSLPRLNRLFAGETPSKMVRRLRFCTSENLPPHNTEYV